MNWETLQTKGIAYSQNPDRLEIQQVEARQPYARVIISEKQTLNIATALTLPSRAQYCESERLAGCCSG